MIPCGEHGETAWCYIQEDHLISTPSDARVYGHTGPTALSMITGTGRGSGLSR